MLNALAYPAMGVMLVTLLLAYSRGALGALALGMALWFCVVPLRLRGAAVLLSAAAARRRGGRVGLLEARAHERQRRARRKRPRAGHQLGVLLLAMVLALALVGLRVGFVTGRRAPSRESRRRAGLDAARGPRR